MKTAGILDKQEVLDRLDFTTFYRGLVPDLKMNGKAEAIGRAPYREDKKPSFSVNLDTGLWYDHRTSEGGNIYDLYMRVKAVDFKTALGEIAAMQGIASCKIKAKEGARRIKVTYDFKDENDKILFQEVRYEPKGFAQRRPDGKGGWIWDLNGTRLVLYDLPKLKDAETVFIVEGPKDAEALKALGYVVTTNPQGAGKWKPEYSETLRDKEIFILPDNDAPGRNHAQNVARSLYSIARSVKIIELPGLPEKGDVSDFIEMRGPEAADAKLLELATSAPEWRPEGTFNPPSFAEILRRPEERAKWVWNGLIPRGRVTLFSAYMKDGKSTLLGGLIVALDEGKDFLGFATEKTSILLLTEEFSTDVRVRLCSLGLGPSKNLFIHGRDAGPLELKGGDLKNLRAFMLSKKIGLLVVDTLPKFWDVESENDASQVTAALKPILDLSAETGAAVLLIAHDRKSEGENGRQIRGSGALFGHVDQALLFSRRQGGTKTQRMLKTLGRYSESPDELLLDYVDGRYVCLGDPQTADNRTAEDLILKALGNETQTRDQIVTTTELKGTTVRRALDSLVENGLIERQGTGKKGDSYLYSARVF